MWVSLNNNSLQEKVFLAGISSAVLKNSLFWRSWILKYGTSKNGFASSKWVSEVIQFLPSHTVTRFPGSIICSVLSRGRQRWALSHRADLLNIKLAIPFLPRRERSPTLPLQSPQLRCDLPSPRPAFSPAILALSGHIPDGAERLTQHAGHIHS